METASSTYAMGRTPGEARRLRQQGRFYAESTNHLLSLAGVGPGMRVLDAGCGAGDVTLQVARRVGPTGSVIGVDVDSDLLSVARRRAAEAGLRNITFQEAALPDVAVEGPVDALVGRLVLIHLDDPVTAVRKMSRLVRPGGLVAFQDFNVTRARMAPAGELMDRTIGWIARALRTVGRAPEAGDQLHTVFREAGLWPVSTAVATPASSDPDSGFAEYVADSFVSMLPLVEKAGATPEELATAGTLGERLRAEQLDNGAVLYAPELVGAWARLPG